VDVVYDADGIVQSEREKEAAMETRQEATEIARILSEKGYETRLWPIDDKNWQEVVKRGRGELIFNMVEEEELGNKVLAWWEKNGSLVTGASYKSNKLSWRKGKVRKILKDAGLPSPRYWILTDREQSKQVEYPAVVKSACDHASFSITADSVVYNRQQLEKQYEWITKNIGKRVLVEEYIKGREIQVTVAGNGKLLVFPVKEIVFGKAFRGRPKILTYEAKWKVESKDYIDTNVIKCPAQISQKQSEIINKVVIKAFRSLKAQDIARFDIRLRGNRPFIVDYNANPAMGLCKLPAQALGLEYADFIEGLVAIAWNRYEAGNHVSDAGYSAVDNNYGFEPVKLSLELA
jgi:D-alanine-D-alanine ligase